METDVVRLQMLRAKQKATIPAPSMLYSSCPGYTLDYPGMINRPQALAPLMADLIPHSVRNHVAKQLGHKHSTPHGHLVPHVHENKKLGPKS
jgi:hypothetical protein